MNEADWLAGARPHRLVIQLQRLHRRLGRPVSERRLRFFALWCCRLAEPALSDGRSRQALEVGERFLAGLASESESVAATEEARSARESLGLEYEANHEVETYGSYRAAGAVHITLASGYLQGIVSRVRDALVFHGEARSKALSESLLGRMADGLRDIFGNPFRPVAFDPSWRSDTAVSLARGMYESRDFSAMPILADSLQDAGCDNADILDHCRDPRGVHVRGCWVVDLVLGKS